ncbi:MAG: TonB family protein [Candidatus Rokuibacteriota bacterium]
MPVAALTVSAIGHVVLLGGLAALVVWSGWETSKTYVVNLVPAVAAVGTPRGESRPTLPTRPTVVPPTREVKLPEPAPREARAREPVQLPNSPPALPQLPSRPVALPRPGDKEAPPLSSPADRQPRPAPPPTASRAGDPVEARPAPPPPAGLATGSVTGVGTLALDVSDFPYAWYLRQVLQKVEDQWQRQGPTQAPAQKPFIMVEIQRDGSIRPPRIEKTSGNTFYDQAALRAIADASPFPPLPQDWSRASLRVMFRFELRPERG